MKKILWCLLAGWSVAQAQAQESFMRWGAVPVEDLTMTTYTPDSSASAVVLGSYGYTFFTRGDMGYQANYRVHYRVKILKKEGYGQANVQIPLLSTEQGQRRESVTDIKAASYNLDVASGQIVRTLLDEKSVYRESLQRKQGREWEEVKFSVPNIKEGTVIEYSYLITSDFFVILNPWDFQADIPVRKSEYQVKIDEALSYVYLLQSNFPFTDSPDVGKKGEENTQQSGFYRWVQEGLPAFKEEGFISSRDDYISRIQFQLESYQYPGNPKREIFTTWPKTIIGLWGNMSYGGFIKRKGATKDLVAQLVAGKGSEREKMEAIYRYVQANLKATNQSGIYTTNSPKEILQKREGNRQEVNLLLINMLREADLNANPVLLSTRSHGKPYKNYPILERFNYSIAHVRIGEEEFLLDATHPLQPLGMLPAETLNGEGLLMAKDGAESGWINLQNRFKSSETVVANLQLQADGSLTGQMEVNLKGYAALDARAKYLKQQAEGEPAKPAGGVGAQYGLQLDSATHLNDYEQPFNLKGTHQSSEFGQPTGDRLYLEPLLGLRMKENPFKAAERRMVVDFAYPYDEHYIFTIKLPPGYEVEELPKSARVQWADKSIRFEYIATAKEGTVQLLCRLFIQRAVFAAEEYKDLRQTFAQMVAKQNEQIVLKKKP
jgi:transglutaminase-like putative cysteine protease